MLRLPTRSFIGALIACTAIAAAAAACGGGDDDSDASSTPGTTPTKTAAASGSATAGGSATASSTDATADPDASPARGTPGAQTPSSAGNTPITGGGGNSTPAPPNPATGLEATIAAEAGGDIAGGDPSQPEQPVGDVPTPPPGAEVDDDEIAPPNPDQSGQRLIVDMDATTAGIQTSRNVNVGDVFRVAIVATDVSGSGLGAFNFDLDYAKNIILAPSYTGGSSSDRNPDLNNAALGDGWTCLPAPEGDLDDAGGSQGDGDPATGRARLSCFLVGGSATGTLVLATIEFHAVSSGNSGLTLTNVAVSDGEAFTIFGRCDGDPDTGPAVPCDDGSVTVQ